MNMSINGNESGSHPTISEWIANAIADTGCRVVYGGHGGALVPLVNAVCSHPNLTWVCARNEHDAATMAAAHAKMTGGLGVVIATSGPGATNLTTGLMEALLDRVSLLAITGMKPTAQLGYAEFQDVNQARLFAGAGIEWSKDVSSPDGVLPLLRDAVSTALSHRTCAHLAIPVDIQAARSPLPLKHFCASHANLRMIGNSGVDTMLLDEAALTLANKVGNPLRRPRNIIAVGLRGVFGDFADAIMELAEVLNAPVLTRLHAKGVVDEFHPLSFGVIGVHGKPGLEFAATLISSCDRVVSIGVDDQTLLICNLAGLQVRKVLEIEPDALAVSTRFEAEHTIAGDIKHICLELANRVELINNRMARKESIKGAIDEKAASVQSSLKMDQIADYVGYMVHNNPEAFAIEKPGHRRRVTAPFLEEKGVKNFMQDANRFWGVIHNSDWRIIKEMHQRMKFKCDFSMVTKNFCHPVAVLDALSSARRDHATDHVSRLATICVDVGDITLWASLCLHLAAGSRTLYSERLGTMGYALCAGIAAILAKPGPSGAVVLAGDGGFQMSLQELATFQQMKRPGDKLLCIVFDNQVLGRVAFGFDDALGCDMIGPDYVALCKAYGGDGVRLDKSVDAEEVIQLALAADGLFLIHVIVDPEVKADMATFHDESLTIMNSG